MRTLEKISLLKYYRLLLIILFYGCNPFAPPYISEEKNIDSRDFYSQKSPHDVLAKFQYTYTFKDSIMYSDILDSSFIFVSNNYNTSEPTTIIWGRDTDIKTTIGLFKHFKVIELVWGDTLYYNQDTLNAEINISFQLTFDGGREFPTITGEALFYFLKKNNQQWLITRWEDRYSF